MFKNVASQYGGFHAFNSTSHADISADGANCGIKLSKDFAAPVAASSTAAITAVTSVGFSGGLYKFELSQAETNCNCLIISVTSATANVVIKPQIIYTNPANFTATTISSAGLVSATAVNVTGIEGVDATNTLRTTNQHLHNTMSVESI
jgi:hypothetical protein